MFRFSNAGCTVAIAVGRDSAGVDRRRRRTGRLALYRILHRQHTQPKYAPCLRAGLPAILRLVRRSRADLDHDPAFDVAAYIETLQKTHSPPAVKQQLAAVRMLFDWLITGQVVPTNPASAVRGPKHVVKTGKTPVLDGKEWRKLLDAIPTDTVRDLRDRALIATLTYSFARITAAVNMKVEDLRPQGAGWRLRLHEKAGKHHTMPCHHSLAEALHAYIAAAGIAEDRKGWLFRTSRGHNATVLSEQPMKQSDA